MPEPSLLQIVQGTAPWPQGKGENERTLGERVFLDALFGSTGGRYHQNDKALIKLRALPLSASDDGVPFAAYIHPSNQDSGMYAGASIAIFPPDAAGKPCLVTFVVGTAGLQPDDDILGRPGHARKVRAICDWLNREQGHGQRVAWAKADPTDTTLPVPDDVQRSFETFGGAFRKYGRVLYGIYRASSDTSEAALGLSAFLDLMFVERGIRLLERVDPNPNEIEASWFRHLLPDAAADDVAALLASRKYVVIQGPPGTGKTHMARELLRERYGENGTVIQFHPNTTYENFVGGLAPQTSSAGIGFQFAPRQGALMEAASRAYADSTRPYLLVIDELNRADLGKVLGEAIYLFEPDQPGREVDLPYDFGVPFGTKLRLPENLHVLGTMNSTDRSLAIVDVAVRRRFSFVKLWPQAAVVDQQANETMSTAFHDLLDIFVEHAAGETFDLVPGHSYFLLNDGDDPKRRLQVTLVPLLEEYLAQGYVSGFAEEIRAYIQWVDSLP